MKTFIFLPFTFMVFAVMSFTNTGAQSRKSGNSGLDSLKQSIKAVGNAFKKATKINIKVNDIKSGDQNLTRLIQNLQHVPGVVNVKPGYEQNDAMIRVSYKGKAPELWQAIPQSSKQLFSALAISDTAIDLSYKYAQSTSQNVVTASNAQPPNTNAPVSESASKQNGQTAALSKGAALLFTNVKSKLTVAEKNDLFKNLGFRISKDGKQFALDDNDAADYPFGVSVYPTDLNKDGVEEIFVLFGNSYTSGMAGSSIVAYIADKAGAYKENFGFPGTLPEILLTKNLGYPDLLIGGPGFEWPVWRWNGKEYGFYKKEKVYEKDLARLKPRSIESLSKEYTATLQ